MSLSCRLFTSDLNKEVQDGVLNSLFSNSNTLHSSEVDCEQSLLFPPVVVYRARKRRPPHSPRGLRFRARFGARYTITGGERRDCLQSSSDAEPTKQPTKALILFTGNTGTRLIKYILAFITSFVCLVFLYQVRIRLVHRQAK